MKILGAGISGLTAAINLAREGYNVEVYEKNKDVGMQTKENAQMLTNLFIREPDAIQELEKYNIKIAPVSNIKSAHIYVNGKKVISLKNTKQSFGYTVLRGGPNSFEVDLKKQAQKLGVKIYTNWDKKIDADIIATGYKKIDAVIYGRVYEGNFDPTKVYIFIDFKYCPGGYAYLYPHNKKQASLVVGTLASQKKDLKESMEKIIRYNRKLTAPFNLSLLYEFGGLSGFNIPKTAIENNSVYIGEAAGFQDPFLGFGMRYAIKSGYLAAKSLIHKDNYDELWKREFITEMNELLAMRNFFFKMDEKMITSILNNIPENFNTEKLNELMKSKKSSLILYLYNKLSRLKFLQYLILLFGKKILK